ncbi:MAG: hypothetical protein IAE90_00880 [Ignavibacteria bacterium]|nr:hypothetical protein [Ignavibacteria bacterium]
MKNFTFVLLIVFFAFTGVYLSGCNGEVGQDLNQDPPTPATDGALVLKSIDGGVTWEKTFIRDFFVVYRICLLSNSSTDKVGMVLSRNGNDIKDLNSTTNFGQSWYSTFQSASQILDIATAPGSGTNGGENFATTTQSSILKSVDEGNTWNVINIGVSGNAIDFYRNNNEENFGIIMPQSSSGNTALYENYNWSLKAPIFNDPSEYLTDCEFIDDTTIIVCGNNGFLSRSTDKGNSWELLETTITSNLRAMDYFGGVIIIGTYEGNIVRSTDRGESWVEITTGLETLNGVFTHTTSFWAFGTNAIAKSTDQGLTWTQVYYDEFDRFNDMIIANNIVYVVGGRYVY